MVPDEGFQYMRLQRAYFDYGKFHAFGQDTSGAKTLTLVGSPSSQPVKTSALDDVHEYAKNVYHTEQAFGSKSALVAYGYDVRPTSSRKFLSFIPRSSTPSWDKIWASEPQPSTIGIEAAREQLATKRFTKFEQADRRKSFGVRLLSDGRRETKEIANSAPVFHPIS